MPCRPRLHTGGGPEEGGQEEHEGPDQTNGDPNPKPNPNPNSNPDSTQVVDLKEEVKENMKDLTRLMGMERECPNPQTQSQP